MGAADFSLSLWFQIEGEEGALITKEQVTIGDHWVCPGSSATSVWLIEAAFFYVSLGVCFDQSDGTFFAAKVEVSIGIGQ